MRLRSGFRFGESGAAARGAGVMASSESWSTEANCGSPQITSITAAGPPQENNRHPEPRNSRGQAQQPFLSNQHPLDPPNAPYVSIAPRLAPNYTSSTPGPSYSTAANSITEVRNHWQSNSQYPYASSLPPYPSYIPRTPHSAATHQYPSSPLPNSNVPSNFTSSYPVHPQPEPSMNPPSYHTVGYARASSVPPLNTPSFPYAISSPFPPTRPPPLRGPQASYDNHPAPWSHISPNISPTNCPQVNPLTGSLRNESPYSLATQDQDPHLDKMSRELRELEKGQKKRHVGQSESDDEEGNGHTGEEQRKERRRKKRRAGDAKERKTYRRDDDDDKDDPTGPKGRHGHYSRRSDRDADRAGMAGHIGGNRSGGGSRRE